MPESEGGVSKETGSTGIVYLSVKGKHKTPPGVFFRRSTIATISASLEIRVLVIHVMEDGGVIGRDFSTQQHRVHDHRTRERRICAYCGLFV